MKNRWKVFFVLFVAGLFIGSYYSRQINSVSGRFLEKDSKKIKSNYKSGVELYRNLKRNGFKIGEQAEGVIINNSFVWPPEKGKISLVAVLGHDLGFEVSVKREDIYKRARLYNLYPVPIKVIPYLCNRNKTRFDVFVIANKPIETKRGLEIFEIVCNEEPFLFVYHEKPNMLWSPDHRWVFMKKTE